jgi:hypothetical protein
MRLVFITYLYVHAPFIFSPAFPVPRSRHGSTLFKFTTLLYDLIIRGFRA